MKRRTLLSAFVTLLVAATAAMGYFFVAGLGEGEHTAELGKGTASNYPVSVSFADGLTPGAKEPVTLMLEPTTATDVKSLALTKTVDATHATAGCKAEWFAVSSNNGEWNEVLNGTKAAAKNPVPIPAGSANFTTTVADVTLEFTETKTNESACEGAHLTIKAVATP
jgi:hypothetical protein